MTYNCSRTHLASYDPLKRLMYDLGLHFKSEINGGDAYHSTSAKKLLVEAYHDVFVVLREIDDFIVSDSWSNLRC